LKKIYFVKSKHNFLKENVRGTRTKDTINAENPPVFRIGGPLKTELVFCSKLAVLHAVEVN